MGTIPTCEEWEGEEGGEGEGEGEEWDPEVTAHDQQLPMLVLPLYSLLSSERQSEVSVCPQPTCAVHVVLTLCTADIPASA